MFDASNWQSKPQTQQGKNNMNTPTDNQTAKSCEAASVAGSATPEKVRGNVTLSTGRTVKHERMKNGAQHAEIVGSATGTMTESEWQEYCDIIADKRTETAKPNAKQSIPAETATPRLRSSGKPTVDDTMLLIAEYDELKAHTAQLAEALKCAEMVLAERGIELKEITRALANYEAAQ